MLFDNYKTEVVEFEGTNPPITYNNELLYIRNGMQEKIAS